MRSPTLPSPPRLVAPGGPVTRALAAGRGEPERAALRDLRRAIAARIEADIALLDRLDGDPNLEDGGDAEPTLCGSGTHPGGAINGNHPSSLGGDDREDGDDTGIADVGGLAEQRGRHLRLVAGGAA